MSNVEPEEPPPKRSAGALKRRRVPLPWPKDRDFRILAIDGGGIRGIFPAAFLARLEQKFLGGAPITQYFDLVAGTSTGGILAAGLGAGLTATELCRLYIERGGEVFPPVPDNILGRFQRRWRGMTQVFKYRYDNAALSSMLQETLHETKLRDSLVRLCIPAFEGRHSEVHVFKTPHHPDFRLDGNEPLAKVAEATATAPTFFRPLQDGGYTFVDGGVWANNPVMIALVDALSCFDLPRERVRILSLGCGDDPYIVTHHMIQQGGLWHWRKIIYGAMRLQSLNAIGQAGLLIGADQLIRIDALTSEQKIEMDDWVRAKAELPRAAATAVDHHGDQVASCFFREAAVPFKPFEA